MKTYKQRKHKPARMCILKNGTIVRGKQAKAAIHHAGSLKR